MDLTPKDTAFSIFARNDGNYTGAIAKPPMFMDPIDDCGTWIEADYWIHRIGSRTFHPPRHLGKSLGACKRVETISVPAKLGTEDGDLDEVTPQISAS